jgi:hypothetical protein
MLMGLMDHWVPSHDAISRFWKTPFAELRPALEALCDEVDVNNFTFYTKWYSNGLKSSLPFLVNHPQAQNVVTDNAWGRELIDFFHGRGMTVGAMLQCYMFDAGRLPPEGVTDSWKDLRRCTGYEQDAEIADPTWPAYADVFAQMLDEELRLFPGLDAFFLEFEGVRFKPDHSLVRDLMAEGDPGRQITAENRALREATGFGAGASAAELCLWTPSVQAALGGALRRNLEVAERVFARHRYAGIRGVVYHAMGYEVPYVHEALPSAAWWLLPWHYWGWGAAEPEPQLRQQVDFVKQRMAEDARAGRPVCYIGNATLPSERFDVVEELLRHSQRIGAAGYLGMGDPLPHYGLRWHGATEESVGRARDVYRRLLPRSQAGRRGAGYEKE